MLSGSGGLWGVGGRFSLSSEEEEGGRRVEVSKESHFCQRLLCYGMSKNHRNQTGAANTSDLVKFAENPCRVLPGKGQEPSGCF